MKTKQRSDSLRQLARLIGVSEKAVRKAEHAGVFRESVYRLGGVAGAVVVRDPTVALVEWRNSGRAIRSAARADVCTTTGGAPDGDRLAMAPKHWLRATAIVSLFE